MKNFCGSLEPHPSHTVIDPEDDRANFTCTGNPPERVAVMAGAGPDAPIEINSNGAGQSSIPYAFHLLDGPALGKAAAVLKEGAEKYGPDNWRALPIEDHLNHLIMHAFAYLAGDRQDDHLSHILCRAIFAQGVDIQGKVWTLQDIYDFHRATRTPVAPR